MKRMLGIVLILIVLAAFTPPGCFAEDAPKSLTCTYLNENQGSLAEGSYKLVDNNCTYSGDITLNGDVTLDLNGNSLVSKDDISCSSSSCSLTITDNTAGNTGTLTVKTIYIYNGALWISGGTVEATGGTYGIYAYGDINISGKSIVTATGTSTYGIYGYGSIAISGTVEKASGGQYGIYAGDSITIESGGKVTEASGGEDGSGIYADGINISGTVTEASGDDYGIYASGGINISGTVTEASGGQYGIYAGGSITIKDGGTVTEASGGQYGIYAGDNITIESGGKVTEASGDDYGIYAGGGITISGTVTEASGGQYGIYADIITISGTVKEASGTNVTGIYADNDIYIFEGGTVTATGGQYGIYAGSHIDINESGTVTATGGTYGIHSGPGGIFISGGQVTANGTNGFGMIAPRSGISLNWTNPDDFIHANSYSASNGTIEALKPFSAFATEEATGVPEATIKAGTVEDTNTINGKWLRPPQFTITWLNDDDTLIDTTSVAGGTTPTHADPAKPDTEQYTYTFDHWEPAPVPAVEDTTYTAVFQEIETPGPEPERPGIDFFRLHADCGLPATGFSALRPTVLPDQPKDLRYEPVRMHLMLPTLDRDVELVTMPREGNSWAAAWLGADAGILEGSALPGEGVSVIAAHNTLNDTDYGPFALLSTLEVNDTVMVREESGALKLFRVYANELLEPDDMERLSALAGEDALVLLTCENESPSGTYLNRRAVFAR